MTLDEVKIYSDDEIKRVSSDGRNKTYIMNLSIDETSENITENLTKYYNSKQISIDVHKCNVRNQYDLMLWW
jgi:hypothetical protein